MKDNSFWSTTQGKSTIKFIAWMIFIIILIVIFAINGKQENNNINNTQEKNEEIISFEKYETMQDNLLNGCFNYEYKIIEENITTIYTGKKLNDTEIGYKETKDGIIKYIKSVHAGLLFAGAALNIVPVISTYSSIVPLVRTTIFASHRPS